MNDYVSRKYLLDEYDRQHQGPPGGARKIIAEAPAADVAPVVHAKWEHVKHKSIEHGEVVIDGDTVRCPACRHAEKGWHAGMNFCPECGAKMDA